MKEHNVIAIDIAKLVFHLVAVTHCGRVLWRRKVRRQQLFNVIVKSGEQYVIAMEACGGSHHWARQLSGLGYRVQLLPPQHIKGYQRGQKSDYNDALAIAEAYQHGRIRMVPVKSLAQQDEQSFHRIRKHLKREQRDINRQIRGLLAEYGVVFKVGPGGLKEGVAMVLEEAENGLTYRIRELIFRQYQRYLALSEEIAWYDRQVLTQVKEDEVKQRLMTIPGVGPLIASLLALWMGDGRQFHCGRDASAAIGLVPRQNTSGDKVRLWYNEKRRSLFTFHPDSWCKSRSQPGEA